MTNKINGTLIQDQSIPESALDFDINNPSGFGTLRSFGATGDGITNDTSAVSSAAQAAEEMNIRINGQGKTYLVDSIPDMLLFENASFKIEDIEYPTKDVPNLDLMRITKTMFCSGWSQEMACVYRPFNDDVSEWIIVPFKYGYGDYFNTSRYACTISFDGEGQDWTEPFILLDYHPNPSVYGYSIWAIGIKNRRLVMAVEERNYSDRRLANLYLYDRALDFSIRNTNNGIGVVNGSSIATVTIQGHGLMPGDVLYFSGVSGAGTNGLSGRKTVNSVIDANTITVDKGSASTVTNPNTGGTSWIVGGSFFQQKWRITPMPTFPNAQGNNLTEVHSFANDSTNPQGFWFGYHNGENSPREVGTIYVDNFYGTPTFTKDRIQPDFEPNAGEPSIREDNGTLYMITRGTSATNTEGGCSFNYKDPGGSWIGYQLPGRIHHSSVPFEIHDGMLYIFSSERSENEWPANAPDNRWKPTRPRTFLLTVPLAEARAGNFTNFKQKVIHYGRFTGEAGASGNGVGTTVKTSSAIWYFWGTQDWRLKGQYSIFPNPALPSGVLPWTGWGIQEDLWGARIKLSDRPGVNDYEDRSADNRSLGVVRYENNVLLEAPVDINNGVCFSGRICLKTTPSIVPIVGGVVTLPNDNSSDYLLDTEGLAANDDLDAILPAPGTSFRNGTVITLSAGSSARDITYRHLSNGGNIRTEAQSNVTLPSAQSTICFKYFNGFWNMQYKCTI